MPVSTPCPQYLAAQPKWKRIRACLGGRDDVLAGGREFGPSLPGVESEDEYGAYLRCGHFYNATARTAQGLAGAIFQKEPKVEGGEQIQDILDDITPRGVVPFGVFARRAFDELLPMGRVGIGVELPEAEPTTAGAKSTVRPVAILYRAEDVVSWETGKRGAQEVLVRVVIKRDGQVRDPKDEFHYEAETTYLVLELSEANVYTQTLWHLEKKTDESGKESTEWVQGESVTPTRRGSTLDFIPFIFVGPQGINPDVARSIMIDLVDANLAHWRNSVDFEYGMHLSALPTPVVTGLGPEDPEPDGKIGPSNWKVIRTSTGQSAQLTYMEFSGAGTAALKAAMEDKKSEMAALGARLLEEPGGFDETATAARLRHSGEDATLADIAIACSAALTQVLKWLAWWAGTAPTPADIKIEATLNREFINVQMSFADMASLLTSLQAEVISYKTFYHLIEVGGRTRPGISDEDELAQIEKERQEREESGGGEGGGEEPPEPPEEGGPNPLSVQQGGPNKFFVVDRESGERMGPYGSADMATGEMRRMMQKRKQGAGQAGGGMMGSGNKGKGGMGMMSGGEGTGMEE